MVMGIFSLDSQVDILWLYPHTWRRLVRSSFRPRITAMFSRTLPYPPPWARLPHAEIMCRLSVVYLSFVFLSGLFGLVGGILCFDLHDFWISCYYALLFCNDLIWGFLCFSFTCLWISCYYALLFQYQDSWTCGPEGDFFRHHSRWWERLRVAWVVWWWPVVSCGYSIRCVILQLIPLYLSQLHLLIIDYFVTLVFSWSS